VIDRHARPDIDAAVSTYARLLGYDLSAKGQPTSPATSCLSADPIGCCRTRQKLASIVGAASRRAELAFDGWLAQSPKGDCERLMAELAPSCLRTASPTAGGCAARVWGLGVGSRGTSHGIQNRDSSLSLASPGAVASTLPFRGLDLHDGPAALARFRATRTGNHWPNFTCGRGTTARVSARLRRQICAVDRSPLYVTRTQAEIAAVRSDQVGAAA